MNEPERNCTHIDNIKQEFYKCSSIGRKTRDFYYSSYEMLMELVDIEYDNDEIKSRLNE